MAWPWAAFLGGSVDWGRVRTIALTVLIVRDEAPLRRDGRSPLGPGHAPRRDQWRLQGGMPNRGGHPKGPQRAGATTVAVRLAARSQEQPPSAAIASFGQAVIRHVALACRLAQGLGERQPQRSVSAVGRPLDRKITARLLTPPKGRLRYDLPLRFGTILVNPFGRRRRP